MEPVSSVKRPWFIGIAGGSCSGKTTIAREVVDRLTPPGAALISIDSYYHGLLSALPEDIDRYNFDDPLALDHDLLVHHMRELAAGRAVDVPVYDFTTHKRTSRVERAEPVSYVVVEGLFPLYWDEVRALLRTKVFVDVPHSVCLERRLRRDTHERGRPREEVIRRYNEMARPMYEKYLLPSRRYADVIVDGEKPVEESVGAVWNDVREKTA
jgi:uridine kinase